MNWLISNNCEYFCLHFIQYIKETEKLNYLLKTKVILLLTAIFSNHSGDWTFRLACYSVDPVQLIRLLDPGLTFTYPHRTGGLERECATSYIL